MQLLTGSVLRLMSAEQRKVVLFSDSRQDAAKIGPNVASSHHEDILRSQLLASLIDRPDIDLARAAIEPEASAEAIAAYQRLQLAAPTLAVAPS